MNILHIDASARTTGSVSRDLSQRFLNHLEAEGLALNIDRLDLAATPPSHVTELMTAGMYTAPDQRTPAMMEALAESDRLCDRVLAADAIVCGLPMYNFGMPSAFKALIDNIVRGGRTFEASETGFVGQLADTKAAFLITSGMDYTPSSPTASMDGLTPHLRTVFGLVGIVEPDIIHSQPMSFYGHQATAEVEAAAIRDIKQTAKAWADAA
ncbi:MAG: NAD(P)H-dependent oxidoreductase [Planctomycetota bacterium]